MEAKSEGQSKLSDRFDPVGYDRWRELVERDLKGAAFDKRLVTRTHEGIEVQPLYAAGPSDSAPRVFRQNASPWKICQICALPDPAAAGEALAEELQSGAAAAWIELNRGVRTGAIRSKDFDQRGVIISDLASLEVLLASVDLSRTPLFLDAGANALSVGALLGTLADRRGIDADALRGGLCCDPIGALVRDGALPTSMKRARANLVTVARWTAEQAPGLTAAMVSTSPYHDAGAHAGQQLAYALATGVMYLRWQVDAGIDVATAAERLLFSFSVGRDMFMELAKLRAARWLWARVLQACGLSDEQAAEMNIHARTAWRTKTARDPWVNMLRSTVEGFVGATGGADWISTSPFDEAIGGDESFTRRIARNTQVILQQESHLGQVVDPAGGSWYVEALTAELGQSAWQHFQQIESDGGMLRFVAEGGVENDLQPVVDARNLALARRRDAITGVSQYPNLAEQRLSRQPTNIAPLVDIEEAEDELAPLGADKDMNAVIEACKARPTTTVAELAEALSTGNDLVGSPLPRRRDAADFEALRDQADQLAKTRGRPPRLLLVNLGAPRDYLPRADFARGFIEAGGIETLDRGGFESAEQAAEAFAATDADGAVLCSSDALYAERAEETARLLSKNGASVLLLAGKPSEEGRYRNAGVTQFIHLGCNVRQTLDALLATLGGAK